jgi:autotransporter-associated beta strand protein
MKIMKWIMAVLLVAGMAQAANRVWSGVNSTNFATAGNWSGANFANTDSMVFSNTATTGTGLYNNLVTANIAVGGIYFTNNAQAYTISGNQIKLWSAQPAPISTLGAANAQIINCDINLNRDGTRNISVGTSAPLTLNGIISNTNTTSASGITLKTGTGAGGTLTLAGNNTYHGLTTVEKGTLVAAHNNALGTTEEGTLVWNTGTLGLSNSITVAESITLAGGILKNFSGSNTLTGAINVTNQLTASINVLTGTQLRLAGGSVDVSTQALAFSPEGTGTLTVDEVIFGSGVVTKSGTGTATFSVANTYGGGTTVSMGTLIGAANGCFGTNGMQVADAATLILQSANTLDDLANLILGSTSSLTMDFTGSDTVAGISLDGGTNWLSAGTYDASALSGLGFGTYGGTGSLTVIPEPATIGMLGLGALITIILRRMRTR